MTKARPLFLECACCGYTQTFQSADEAFEKGWDCPPAFTVVCCPLCPTVCALGIVSHNRAHEQWAEEGRPDAFRLDKCASDGVIDKPTELRRAETALRKIKAVYKAIRRKEKDQ